ncbi:MAG: phosphodiester glycosidase family protein [Saprospiraceae bacterium]|nr:phosphodiester glycosidase family protein [Saprospiraceae bacterium]
MTKYPNILESGPLLMIDGQNITLSATPFNDNRHPRSCVCLTDTDIIILAVDGRNAQAQGMNLGELSSILTWLKCTSALISMVVDLLPLYRW